MHGRIASGEGPGGGRERKVSEQDEQPLWQPGERRVAGTNLARFMAEVAHRWDVEVPDFAALHRWSVDQPEDFWLTVWDFCAVRAATRGGKVVENREKMPGARWFPEARLNFAENLLRGEGEDEAIVFWGEDRVKRRLSHDELRAQVSRLQQALRAAGVGVGDRVAGFLPNLPETIIAMLATTSLGAVWSSCSPDFGVQGVLDRFGQIEPKVLLVTDGYHYGGKEFDCLDKARAIIAELPSLEQVILVPYLDPAGAGQALPGAVALDDLLAPHPAGEIEYTRVDFNAPLYIMYSSGTTGAPKCIVHGVGGTLSQHLKEHQLHADVRPGDRLFFFTTCGWMMWNWLASGLASGATILLFDGLPAHPDGNILFDFAQAEGMTHFGTSAKWLDSIAKAGIAPIDSHDLSKLRVMMSTGSPLAPQGFDYVYDWIKRDIHLASISGGTDIISCFIGGDPTGPVWRGEIQAPGLGMRIEVFDETGQALPQGQGELVCTASFPSMPIGFWNDPDGSRYHAAYFDVYPNVWRHGDWVEFTHHGGMVIHGRSDATLNPGGVRIGTAEIYRQVEQLDEVLEGLVIGQQWHDDTRVVLFVVLRQGAELDDDLIGRIKAKIRSGASPRHVPALVLRVADIPRTVNNKITELAVTDVIHGRPVKNREALANPEALDLYKDLPELAV
ncbi:MAG: acetoacetate--CoA ligase [Alphaproteobacteria bacterium]|jgi:acetoacetyl-CoA synthetase|nr:acetoacetate--CoA ligase [Alphaproteobacteria bacterium]MDP6813163.1 acetoacetate--CoA ligase [Alphaproteobacteria bacterium]